MNTYLYGIGPRTEKYIADHPDMEINGILDGYRQSGEFCGIQVLALEDISTECTRIVIVARPASAKIIYARIKEFCIERKVKIYDINGREMEPTKDHGLSEAIIESKGGFYYPSAMNADQFKIDKYKIDMRRLYQEIDSHQAVSFDIFDTLLVRKCGSVEKLFAYVAMKNGLPREFVEERVRAEKELSQSMVPAIEDIYKRIAENMAISWEESRQILMEEIESEKKFLVVRKELVEAFRYAIAKEKQVFLVSDMYLSGKALKGILAEKGIDGYAKLFVSCEYGTDKAGNLFDIVIGQADGKSLLHIGDDEYRDQECARRHGVDVFPVWTTTEDIGWNLANPETIGYSILGPALFSFALWLDLTLRKDGISRIYFSARDGYLVKQIFDMIEQCIEAHSIKAHSTERHSIEGYGIKVHNVKDNRVVGGPIISEYLLTSRTLTAAASLCGENDIRRVRELSFDGEPTEMLKKRFYLEEDEILPCDNDIDSEKYILLHTEAILKKSKHLKSNYLKYLEKIGLTKEKKTAIFDFVSTGTCQMCLERILGKSLYGYYYETVDDETLCKSELRKKGFIQDIGIQYSCDNYFYIETLIKETVPTLREIDNTGTVIYGKEYMEPYQKEVIRTVQEEAVRYVKDRLELIPDVEWRSDRIFEPEEARENVCRVRWITTKLLAADKTFKNYDAFSNREINE